ncbi:MAG: protein kinase [Kofleriaceae bacterium]|nr:protein kinase [Kofleriaceae bacterium]
MHGGPPGPDPIIGQTIGNYQVRQKLGEGGMGAVYMAEHPHIGKKVALKVLHSEFAANPDVVARFFNEAKAVNDIGHPNIVDIVDYGVLTTGPSGEGLVYFIMEFLPGITLTELIRREAPMAPERALSICLQVADALSASHKCNIVHRDLKPDNIILIQRGREKDFVKLLDFGIAKLTGDQPGSRRTRTGLVMGTPAYMSPEQCEGRGNVDHRADVYALGIVLYEMITGRVPFYGDGYGEVLVQHLTQAPAPPSTIRGLIPPHVEQVILKALEKRPEMRFPTMDEMSKALLDPVGYVESHGGIANFLSTPITPSDEPVAPVSRLTPSPISRLTPVPGSVTTPTTLGAAAGQVAGAGGSKKGLFIGLGVAAVAAAVVAVIVLGGGGSKKNDDAGGEVATGLTGTGGSAAATGGTTASAGGSDTGAGTASGGDTGAGTASGSAVTGEVTVSVTSSPKGAFVLFGDDPRPKGKTPLKLKVPAADAEVEISVELPGYESELRKVRLSGNVDLEVALEKKRRGGTSGTSGSDRGSGKGSDKGSGKGTGKGTGTTVTGDDVMDPFK